MSLLSQIIHDPPLPHQSFLIFQSSIAQSSVPVLRQILTNNLKARTSNHFLLFSLAFPPSNILQDSSLISDIEIFDWVGTVPSYDDGWSDPRASIFRAVENAPKGSLQVVIDSIDVLCSDIGCVTVTYQFLFELLVHIRARPAPSRLILHSTRPSKLIPLLTQPAFSPSIIQLTSHPPVLLSHLAKDYLILPPPTSPRSKFWNTFLPLSERVHEVEFLVYGANGDGNGGAAETVVEILVRGGEGSSRKRAIERELEGWSLVKGVCDITRLETLKSFISQNMTGEITADPTRNVSFNLNLTLSQQESRAQVPLPYAHEGKGPVMALDAAIFYDPDSADDIDDDDPDEDLDI